MHSEHLQRPDGFTLLEVLVALVIVGLGLMAVFSQLNQTIMTASMLRDRTLAHWVAVDRITELRLEGVLTDSASLDAVRLALFDASAGALRLDLSKLKLAR